MLTLLERKLLLALTLCYLSINIWNLGFASAASRNNDRESSLSKLIYEKIQGARGCFRRMNGTHQIGCSSGFKGNVGVVHMVESNSSIEWILEKGPHSPYVVLLKPQSFTLEMLQRLQSVEGSVNGVLLLKDKTIPQFSTDSKCPNLELGFYRKNPVCHLWNEPGSDIMYHDWQFPIFYVDNNASISSLQICYNSFNKPGPDGTPRDWPLCGAELHEFMLAAVNSETCVRRNHINAYSITPSRLCDPIGDMNIHSTLIPSSQTEPFSNKSVIVIGARMDASSLFDRISPGADSAITGFTAVLALIKQLQPLKELVEKSSKVSNIYFMLFNGEAFDYTGSSRLVYDMMANSFPVKIDSNETTLPAVLNMTDIKYYIELGQLSPYEGTSEYFIHRNWDSQIPNSNSVELDKLVTTLQRNAIGGIKLTSVQKNNDWWGLPPSSLQSFLHRDPNFPGIVITNHDKSFRNKYYNSIYDDAKNVNYKSNGTSSVAKEISNLVATVTRAIEEIVSENTPSISTPDTELVNNILECYLESPRCQLFQNVSGLPHEGLPAEPFPLYVGVYGHPNDMTHFTMSVMAYFQGSAVNRSKDDCKRMENDTQNMEYLWMDDNCYLTTTRLSPAVSPVFTDITDYDWKSKEYPTWTESVWTLQTMTVRIFLKPSFTQEILTLLLGLTVFLSSTFLFSWINRKSDILFQPRYLGYMTVPPN